MRNRGCGVRVVQSFARSVLNVGREIDIERELDHTRRAFKSMV